MSISLPNGTLLATPAQQTQYTAAVTRILHLSNFPAELKTRDLQSMFKEYENDKGGFRIKWVDDTNALVVFADAGVAKRAYLTHLLSPPPNFPPPAHIAPYVKPDANQIIQSLAARAMGHRSSMSNYSQQLPLGAVPVNGMGMGNLDGLPNGANGGGGAGIGVGHIRAGSINKAAPGAPGAGWTFPAAVSARSGSASTGLGSGAGANTAPTGLMGMGAIGSPGNRHGRTGSSSFSRSAMGSIGGGALSFGSSPGSGPGAGGASGSGTGIGGGTGANTGVSRTGGLPTHTESLDSPAIPAGFSTTRQEGVGGGSSRRLTGRHGGGTSMMGGASLTAGAPAGLGFGGPASTARQSNTNNNNPGAAGAGVARPDSRTSHSGHSVRSGDSSDTEPIVVMKEPTPVTSSSSSSGIGNTIDGRGKVPFGQWKMPSSASASPTPTGTVTGGSGSVSPGQGGQGGQGGQARRDSVSADKALREVEKALRGVEAQS